MAGSRRRRLDDDGEKSAVDSVSAGVEEREDESGAKGSKSWVIPGLCSDYIVSRPNQIQICRYPRIVDSRRITSWFPTYPFSFGHRIVGMVELDATRKLVLEECHPIQDITERGGEVYKGDVLSTSLREI